VPRNSGLESKVSRRTTEISLHVASVVVGALDGQVAIDWDSGDKRDAILDDEPFAAGKTKKVYLVKCPFDIFYKKTDDVER
jgi:hypothetical protein